MPISEFESAIYNKIKLWIESGHKGLEVQLPSGPTVQIGGVSMPSPDLLITNPSSGRAVAIEIKAYSHPLPIGVYPQLKEMRNSLASVGSEFVVVSSAPATAILAANVDSSGIPIIQASDPNAAFKQLEARLQAFELREGLAQSTSAAVKPSGTR